MIKFFSDENISKKITQILDIYDNINSITWLPDYFDKRGLPDTEWIPKIAAKEPDAVILSGDKSIRSTPQERLVLKESNLMFVFITGNYSNLNYRDQVIKILQAWDEIVKKVKKSKSQGNYLHHVKIRKTGSAVFYTEGLTKDLYIDDRRL